MVNNMKARYVAGFLFSLDGAHVALVEKQKPDWQKNKWNGIGGKIEEGELPSQAMQREFKEEAGLDISNWTRFCVLVGNDSAYNTNGNEFEVHFFSHFSDDVYNVKTMETEEIALHPAKSIMHMNVIPNLKWLIPLALEKGLMAEVFDGLIKL